MEQFCAVRVGSPLYYLALEDIETADPSSLYVVVGTPTPRDVFYPDEPDSRPATLRTYTLGTDYTRQNLDIVSDVPLLTLSAAEAFGNAFLQAAAETPFYVIERADVTPSAKTLYGALRIEGQGAAQRSMIVSDAGIVFSNLVSTGEDALGIGGTRRGSYRLSSNSESVFMRGGTGSTVIENPMCSRPLPARTERPLSIHPPLIPDWPETMPGAMSNSLM